MKFLLLLGLVPAILFFTVEASSGWDNIPIISQGKSLVLLIMNKPNEAKETWDNFKNLTLLWDNIKDMDNSIPIYGHGKAIILILLGDEERGMDVMAAATKSLITMAGSATGGPFGALAGSVGSDALFSMIKNKPVGIVEYIDNFHNKKASQHIDNALGIGIFFVQFKGSKSSSESSSGIKGSSRKSSKNFEENIPLLKDGIKLTVNELNSMINSGKLSNKNALSIKDALSSEWLTTVISGIQNNYESQSLRAGLTELTKYIREDYIINKIAEKKFGEPYTAEEIHILKTIDEDNYLKKYADVAGIKIVDKALKILKNFKIANDIVKKTIGITYTLEEIKFLNSIDIDVNKLTSETITTLSHQVKLIEEASLIEYKPFKPAPAVFTFNELCAMHYEINKKINDIKTGVKNVTKEKYTIKELEALDEQINKMIELLHKNIILKEQIPNYSAIELDYMIDTLKDDYLSDVKTDSKNIENIIK